MLCFYTGLNGDVVIFGNLFLALLRNKNLSKLFLLMPNTKTVTSLLNIQYDIYNSNQLKVQANVRTNLK